MKRFIWSLMVGAGLGTGIAAWIAPKFIAWYFEPPAQYGISCKAPIEWALHRLLLAQIWGAVIGAACAIVITFLVFRRKNSHPEAVPLD
ncbi:MAG: hypothetical protein HY537_14385 [Deltaproteobacteria bacterium]|nr:hypothetical protein [Deltaproteobacteria bacterium]